MWDNPTLLTAAHVINLSPAVALQSDVPNSVWYGKDVSYDHLRLFCCKTFVDVPKDERSKLDAKTRQCIFIRYVLYEFCYRIYDPIKKKLMRIRDIIIMENQTIEDIDKAEKVESSSFDDIVHHDDIPHTSVHDVVGLDNHGDAHNHVFMLIITIILLLMILLLMKLWTNQIFCLGGSQDKDFLPLVIHPMSMCY